MFALQRRISRVLTENKEERHNSDYRDGPGQDHQHSQGVPDIHNNHPKQEIQDDDCLLV